MKFFICVILWAGFNEIESNIVNCRIVSWQEKEGENKNTKWEKNRDRCGCMVLNIQETFISVRKKQ